jgi:DNA-binding MarR family transcriptional regulator
MNLDAQENGLSRGSKHEHLWKDVDHEVARFQDATTAFDQAVADSLGLNRGDVQCLGVVVTRGPMTAGALAEACNLTSGSVTALLDRMERAGYLRRAPDPEDRRRVVVEATQQATDKLSRLYGLVAEAERARLEGFTDEQVGAVRDYLSAGADVRAEQAAAMRAALGGNPSAHELSAPLGAIAAGRLVFQFGASLVRIDADPSMPDLFRVHFEGSPPQVESHDGVVAIRSRKLSLLAFRKHQATSVTLNGSIPWAIELRGGISQIAADLANLRLESVVLTGGASQVELTLGRPQGTVPVRISGGASDFTVTRPRGTPTRLRVRGNASTASVDGTPVGPIVGSAWLDFPGDGGSGRYDIEVSGGASTLRVDPA